MDEDKYFLQWYRLRSNSVIAQRAKSLLSRYGLSPVKAIDRIQACIENLEQFGCYPSFPTPGVILKYHPNQIKKIQDCGAEITVHGYQHLDFRLIPVSQAVDQLVKASRLFEANGIPPVGFRCPYLGCSEELIEALPIGLFDYSSNETVCWRTGDDFSNVNQEMFYQTLGKFYGGKSSSQAINVPYHRHKLVEIRVSVPDDLQLFDGLQLSSEDVGHSWINMFNEIYQRGEHFNIMFHPELASKCSTAFIILLDYVKHMKPHVWIAKLCDISDWWKEKKSFVADIKTTQGGFRVQFVHTPRATLLVKGLDHLDHLQPWDENYFQFTGETIDILDQTIPFLGLAYDVPETWRDFLREQGYIVYFGEDAYSCSIFLENKLFSGALSEVEIIQYIESQVTSLIRFWRWPDGAKCALSITGDLDALSLFDYSTRLFDR